MVPSARTLLMFPLLYPVLLLIVNQLAGTGAQSLTPFEFTSEPGDLTVAPGSNVELSCGAKFNNTPVSRSSIMWIRTRDGPINFNNPNQPLNRTVSGLFLSNLLDRDSTGFSLASSTPTGDYTCIAAHGAIGKIRSAPARLRVQGIGAVLVHPTNLSISRDVQSVAVFECGMEARGPVSLVWLRGGSPLGSSERFRIYTASTLDAVSSTLEITNPTTQEVGLYACRASIAAQTVTSNPASLSIGSSTGQIAILLPPRSTEVTPAKSAWLHCGASDYNTITWYKDDQILQTRLFGTFPTLELSVDSAGSYYCQAEKVGKIVRSAAVDVIVLAPPRVVTSPKSLIKYEADEAVFTCLITGNPPPTVTWYHDGEELLPSDYFIINETSLTIAGLLTTDSGYYQCAGSNKLSTAHATAQLIAKPTALRPGKTVSGTLRPVRSLISPDSQQAPDQVSGFRSIYTDSNSVTVQWVRAADASLWEVTTLPSGDSSRVRRYNTTQTQYKISNLAADTLYDVSVTAYNFYGSSSPPRLPLISVRTHPLSPSGLNIIAEVDGSSSFSVSWNLLSVSGLQYRISYVNVGVTPILRTHHVSASASPASRTMLTGLAPFTSYTVWVEAWQQSSFHERSNNVTVTTYSDVPSAPPTSLVLQTLSTTSISVQWSPPPADQANGVISGYKLRWKKTTTISFDRPRVETFEGDARSAQLTELEPGTIYHVKLAAMTVNGTGVYTAWHAAETNSQTLDESRRPGQVLTVQMIPFRTKMIVTWQPADDNVLVKEYKIGWGNADFNENWETVDGSKFVFIIDNLGPSTLVNVAVIAKNNAGESDSKLQSASTLSLDERLLPPTQVLAETVSSSEITVRWYDTQLGNLQWNPDPEGRYYTVRYAIRNTDPQVYMFKNTTDLGAHIEGLQAFTEYTFSVKVSSSPALPSVFSLSAHNKTLDGLPSSSPTGLSATPSSDRPDTATLVWGPSPRLNGRVVNYRIYYTDGDINEPVDQWLYIDRPPQAITTRRGSSFSYDFGPIDIPFHFRVSVFNNAGQSPVSSPVTFTPAKHAVDQNGNPLTGEGVTYETDQPDNESDGSGLPGYLWYAIAGVAVFAAIIIVVTLFLVCRRKGEAETKDDTTANRAQPADMWLDQNEQLEMKRRSHLTDPRDSEPDERCSMMNSQLDVSVSMAGDVPPVVNYPIDESTQYQSIGRARPIVISPTNQQYRDAMPRAAVSPLVNSDPHRPLYPRNQFAGPPQYGSTPRVNVGDTSQPSSGSYQLAPVPKSPLHEISEAPSGLGPNHYGTSNAHVPRHIVKPQAHVTASPFKPAVPSPLAGASTTASMHAGLTSGNDDSMTRSRYCTSPGSSLPSGSPSHASVAPPAGHSRGHRPARHVPSDGCSSGLSQLESPKEAKHGMMTRSTEQLSAEMAHLDCIMQDLNSIKTTFK